MFEYKEMDQLVLVNILQMKNILTEECTSMEMDLTSNCLVQKQLWQQIVKASSFD